VPPSDAQSNYKMARDALFEPLAIAAEQIFRIRGEDEPGTAARAYADALKTELGPNPVFDLILLGMGPDGHTASLFPGSDPCEDDELLVRAPYVAKFSTYRITVTPRLINAGREVVIAAAGSEKAAPLATALEGPYDPKACPIQIVHPADGRLTWLVDRAAGGRLRGRVI
jgi:6-phosphogluconolactonase